MGNSQICFFRWERNVQLHKYAVALHSEVGGLRGLEYHLIFICRGWGKYRWSSIFFNSPAIFWKDVIGQCGRATSKTIHSSLNTSYAESESKLLYDWRFTANQFFLVPSPLRLTTRLFYDWTLSDEKMGLSPMNRLRLCQVAEMHI
jgi:hypothetical protein